MVDATYIDDLPEPGFALTPGLVVSGIGHVGLLTWLVIGWGLNQEPLPFETMDVSVVSSAEYAALVNRGNPQVDPADPVALTQPETDVPPQVTQEQPVTQSVPDAPPAVPADEVPPQALEPVPPPAQIEDTVPVLEAPTLPAPPVVPDAPAAEDPPQAEVAPRVAPEAAPAPPLNADVAPQVQQDSAPTAQEAEVVEDTQEATAPEQAAAEIVTEAERPSGAVATAVRPPARPVRAAVAEVEPDPEPAPTDAAPQDTTLDDLLADVAAEPAPQPAAQETAGDPGPPMTGGERDAFRVAVQGCWVVDVGSQAASVTVTIAFSLGRDGRVVGSQVEMVSNSGGSNAAVTAAFDAARRAVLRCQSTGFPLPAEKYEQWRNVEMTFNPTEMRIR